VKPVKSFAELRKDLSAPGGQMAAPLPAVLVIDDDVATRDSLLIVLKDHYQITVCMSAEAGVTALTDDMCAVILDVKMKDHDGFWVCDEIRKKNADIPVIFYSAYQDAKDPFQIINDHRPFGYIIKDGNTQKLRHALDMAVSLYQLNREKNTLLKIFQANSARTQ
jgi:DNA-binding NtrC family response regulator